ncbi:hypothetical protein JMJ35_002571 [Cladonia borealis]|uniref:Uncharacterized protein n=1 Tax=Cladonia borealis TaxID=184061 RepID=A0AA39R5D4_9LECA|nr:hypothetical protein JMJ35_002571 [Cladonia borealis]
MGLLLEFEMADLAVSHWEEQMEGPVANGWYYALMFVLTFLFAASLGLISRNHQATNHRMNGETPAEQLEDRKITSLEETLRKKIAELEDDVQAANDDSTAWMELYHEQEAKTRSQSHQIERASTTLGSRLTYLDLKAQVQGLEIKCNSLRAELRDSDHLIEMKTTCEKQRQGKDRLVISKLQGRVRELLRHECQHVPTLQATELKREKAASANLRHIIAQKDEDLRAAAQKISQLDKGSVDDQVLFNKAKDDLNEKLIQTNHKITKLQDQAAREKTNSSDVEKTHKQQLSLKDTEIKRITAACSHEREEVERLKQEVTRLEARESSLNTSLSKAQSERDESQASSKSMEQKLKELETVHEKCTRSRTPETMAPPPSGLARAASEGMDVDSPVQLLVENQKQDLDRQQREIKGLEESNKVLRRQLQSFEKKNEDHEMSDVSTTDWREQSKIAAQERELKELREEVDAWRHGDQEMSDAFDIDTQDRTQERLREITESHSQTINMLNQQVASLQQENGQLKAQADQNGSLGSGGRELLDANITRLGKEKEDMNTNLQKARKLSENLKKERDQLREVKTKITHEKAEIAKIQQENLGKLEKLRVEKAKLDEKCASLQKEVEGLKNLKQTTDKTTQTTGETREEGRPSRKRSAPEDGEVKAMEKRLKTDDSESSNT